MTLSQEDLEGAYQITTVSDYTGPVPMQSDGQTEIKNGETHRTDKKGCHWHTVFEVIDDTTVKMTSIADPSQAEGDFCLTLPNGDLTRSPVTYVAELKVARQGERLRLSGQIEHGKVITVMTMTKI